MMDWSGLYDTRPEVDTTGLTLHSSNVFLFSSNMHNLCRNDRERTMRSTFLLVHEMLSRSGNNPFLIIFDSTLISWDRLRRR